MNSKVFHNYRKNRPITILFWLSYARDTIFHIQKKLATFPCKAGSRGESNKAINSPLRVRRFRQLFMRFHISLQPPPSIVPRVLEFYHISQCHKETPQTNINVCSYLYRQTIKQSFSYLCKSFVNFSAPLKCVINKSITRNHFYERIFF